MRYKGIIFDLDGVICSTDEYHYLAWKALADRLGIPFDRENNNRLRGVSRMASLEIVLEKADRTYTDEEKAAFAEEKNANYRRLLGRMSPADLTDEVRASLDALRAAGSVMVRPFVCSLSWFNINDNGRGAHVRRPGKVVQLLDTS